MKKLEHKLLPCLFCTIGLNTYVLGHNLLHATVEKITKDIVSLQSSGESGTQTDNVPTTVYTSQKSTVK